LINLLNFLFIIIFEYTTRGGQQPDRTPFDDRVQDEKKKRRERLPSGTYLSRSALPVSAAAQVKKRIARSFNRFPSR
jgi:hypothetical protein